MRRWQWMEMVLLLALLMGCTPRPVQVTEVDGWPEIYPDYKGITVPYNIAPLNFMLRNEAADALQVMVRGKSDSLRLNVRGRKACFDLERWHQLLQACRNETLRVTVTARVEKQWMSYRPLLWEVSGDAVDSYITYRLIEPGYEVWNALQLCERNLENFDERLLADNRELGGRCMNCHIHGSNRGDRSFFHLRGKGGGTLLNQGGKLRKLTLKAGPMTSGAVYGDFHPQGRYAVFSTNTILPTFHTIGNRRLEVYDTESDLVMADLEERRLISASCVADTTRLETFPTFSADGTWVYFCSAPIVPLPQEVERLRYSLCRVAFDAESGRWGAEVDTLWSADRCGGSVCHPKASPDGRYLLYTVARYGTFPIWHRETQLQLMELATGRVDTLSRVNSDRSDTYHSWSANSRWFAFASKRGDGQYGRIYLAHVAPDGVTGAPFVLPQQDPEHDDMNLKSYNIPDLSDGETTFGPVEVTALEQVEAEPFEWIKQE